MAAKAPFNFWSFFFSTRGRVSRVPFALFEVTLALAIIGMALAVFLLSQKSTGKPFPFLIFALAASVIYVTTLWSRFAVMVKRCHDIGWAWGVAFPMLAPLLVFGFGVSLLEMRRIYNLGSAESFNQIRNITDLVVAIAYHVLIIALCFIPGRKGTNRHGPDPRRPETAVDQF